MKIGIVGATGEVGRMMITCLEELHVPVSKLRLFASARSAGCVLPFHGIATEVEELTEKVMQERYSALLFSAGGDVSRQFAPVAEAAGNTIIDNSSAFRRHVDKPLIIPEINGASLKNYRGIIANPNCSTIQMLLALHPLDKQYGLQKVIVSTYQSVSGAGQKGIRILKLQRQEVPDLGPFPKKIDLNVIPQIGPILGDGYCEEEDKMRFETCKILGNDKIGVSATTVRVPVFHGHAESVYAEFRHPVDLAEAAFLLSSSPSVKFHTNDYITPAELGDSNDSHVCRLRFGIEQNSLTFWNVGHNVRLGAATNAVRILKHLIALGQVHDV
jgi:aspartate-semialdehyde dehydrogenase